MNPFFVGMCLLVILAAWLSFLFSAKPNHNCVLGVTMPKEAWKSPEVMRILRAYRRNLCFLFAMIAALSFSILLLPESLFLSFLFLWFWILAVALSGEWIYRHYHHRLYALKKREGWLVGKRHMVMVDTRVSQLKHTMPVSRWWFLPGITVSVACPLAGVFCFPQFAPFSWMGCWIPLILTAAFFIPYEAAVTRPAQVYSEDTQVNRSCNCLYQRGWSKCWVVCSYVQSIGGSLFYLLLLFFPEDYCLWPMIPILGSSILILMIPFYFWDRIRRGQEAILSSQNCPVYVDEDEFWISGFYNNPHNSHVLVEKRSGMGYTFNLATFWGKMLTAASLLILIVMVFTAGFFLFQLDSKEISMRIDQRTVSIEAPLYGTTFSTEEIQSVESLDTLPEKRRINGASTPSYALGYYQVSGYGECTLFVHTQNPPYLLIRLPNRTILFNGGTPEQTREYQNSLAAAISP